MLANWLKLKRDFVDDFVSNNLLIQLTLIYVVISLVSGVTMREKKGGALQKLKKRLSHSFGRLCKYKNILWPFYRPFSLSQ